MAASEPTRRLVIQLHPADPRWRTLRLELGRRGVLLAKGLLVAYGVFLAVAAALAPAVVRDLASASAYGDAVSERAALGEQLQRNVARLEELRDWAEQSRAQLDKVYLAYGLGPELAPRGAGGFTVTPDAPLVQSIYGGVARHGAGLEAQIATDVGALAAMLNEVTAFEAANREAVLATPSRSPVGAADFVLVSGFGPRRNPFTRQLDFHTGADLSAPVGTPVLAPGDGVVVFAGRFPLRQSLVWWRLGNLVVLRHGDRFVTLFGHLDTTMVREGQAIKQGDQLGTVGNSGWSTSPHLHYEVRRREADGMLAPVDPRVYVLDQSWPGTPREAAGTVPPSFEPLPATIARRR